MVNTDGSPVTGTVDLRFELAYALTPGTILCHHEIDDVPLTNGVFHSKIEFAPSECTTPLSTILLNATSTNSPVIRVIDQSNTKTYSFQAIHSMPYALVSNTAKTLAPLAPADTGKVLQWNGTEWVPATLGSGSGSVNNVSTGTGLTGGPITTTGTISIANGGVGTTQLADGAVTDIKIASGIARSKIAAGAASQIVVNDGTGALSSVATVPLAQGGTAATNATDARANLGLGAAAVLGVGYTGTNLMPGAGVPTCFSGFKLQFTGAGPTWWSCIAEDGNDNSKLPLAGGTMVGAIEMSGFKVTGLPTPVDPDDAANKDYVDNKISSESLWGLTGGNIHRTSGFVGIGTTSPTHKFNIVEPTAVNDSVNEIVSYKSGSDPSLGPLGMVFWLKPSATGANRVAGIGIGDNLSGRSLSFTNSNGVPYNIGIGTQNPQNRLDVMGSIHSGISDGSKTGITLGSNGAESPKIEFNLSDGSQRFFFQTNDANAPNERLSLYAGPLNLIATEEAVSFSGTGRVGFGVIAPTARIHMSAGSTTTNSAPLKFTSGPPMTTPEAGAVEFDGTNLYFTDNTNTRKALATSVGASSFQPSSGNAGSPSYSFSTDTNTGFYSSGTDQIGISTGGAQIFSFGANGLVSPVSGGGAVSSGAGTASAPTFSFAGDADTGWYAPSADTLAAATAGIERVRINSIGLVGINTNNPTAMLDINKGNQLFSGDLLNLQQAYSGTSYDYARLTMGVGNQAHARLVAGSIAGASNNNPGFLDIYTNNLSAVAERRMRIDHAGNVGIGTDAPLAPLSVGGPNGAFISTHTVPASNYLAGAFGSGVHWNGANWVSRGDGGANGGALMAAQKSGGLHFFIFPNNSGGDQVTTDSGLYNFRRFSVGSNGAAEFIGPANSSINFDPATLDDPAINLYRTTGTGDFYPISIRNSVNGETDLGDLAFRNAAPITNKGTESFITRMVLKTNGRFGVGVLNPNALLHLGNSSGAAPLKFTSSAVLGTPQAGAVEYDGTNLFFTDSTNTRKTLTSASGSGAMSGISSISNASGNIALTPNAFTGAVSIGPGAVSSGPTSGTLVVTGDTGISGVLNAGGTISSNSKFVAPSATSSSAPTYSFASDPDTGWYNPAPDNLAAAVAGVERIRIRETGQTQFFGYPIGAASLNAYSLEVGGTAPTSTNGQATIFFHHQGVLAHQLRYASGKFNFEAAGNGYGSTASPIVSVGGKVITSNGLVTAPSYSFINDSTSGMYLDSPQVVGLVANGTEHLRINSAGVHSLSPMNIGQDYAPSTGTLPGFGMSLNFLGGPSPAGFASSNSDPLWMARYNKASDESELRVNIGDNPQGGDAFVIGYSDPTFNPNFRFQSDGKMSIGPYAPADALSISPNSAASVGHVSVVTPLSGPFFTGHETGAGYATSNAIFNAITDNPNGSANFFFKGTTGGTLTSYIRADGLGYFGNIHSSGSQATEVGSNGPTGNGSVVVEAQINGRTPGTGAALVFRLPANTDGSNSWEQGRILTTPDNSNNADAQGRMYLQTRYPSGADWLWRSNLVLLSNGNVGVGTSTASELLEVNGNAKAVAFLYTSDARLKKDIKPIENPLEKIMKLRGVEFKWKSSNEKTLGFIAQDVEKVVPELVRTDKKSNMKSVQYGNIIAIVVEAIKKMSSDNHREVASLKQENKELKTKVESLEKRLERLEQNAKK